jgi:hypothetical protein
MADLPGAATAAGVTAGHHMCADVLGKALDVRGGDLVEAPLTPVVGDAVPVAAVDPAGAGTDAAYTIGM